MNNIANTILEKYQIRKTSGQKKQFIELVESYAKTKGYSCRVEKGMLGAKNIIVGDPESANVIYTAHYDTCPRLPFPNFITPKKFSLYLLYQLAISLGAFVLAFAIGYVVGFVSVFVGTMLEFSEELIDTMINVSAFVTIYGLLFLLVAGPANKHTANDNTSGVVTLLEIMRKMPEDKLGNAAFVFFDLEESGLFGSAGYASKHKNHKLNKLVVNFDCVSDGNHILFALRKGAKAHRPTLEKHFASNEDFEVEILDKGVFYPSDQMNFACGVGVAALKYSKRLKTLYMDRIHTKRDVILDEKNIEFLSDRAVNMACEG